MARPATLETTAATLREQTWRMLRDARLGGIPSNTFSLYDHILDAVVAVDAIPDRFRELGLDPLDTYFAMARGTGTQPPLELTKWFDTTYHHLVPEIGHTTVFAARPAKALREHAEANALGVTTRPVLIGPATFLLLAKPTPDAPDNFRPLDRLADLVEVYAELLGALANAGVAWVQLDEPAYVGDRTVNEIDALRTAYTRLGELEKRPRLFVASYFGELGDALSALLDTPVEAIGLDLVAGPGDLNRLAGYGRIPGRTIVAGLVDGRNIWRTDLRAAAATGATLMGLADQVAVSTSCSLLHVPVDLASETDLDPRLRDRLAFARQKVDEVVALGLALRDGIAVLPASPSAAPAGWRDNGVRARLDALRPEHVRRGPYAQRAVAQQARLALPALPTTTIGSFPQTDELRKARAEHRAGRLDNAGYAERIRAEIAHTIALQERLGLHVLVHGEPERDDMVQYFATQLNGFATTTHGWVQSYGARCVRPPILYGDVTRSGPMTVSWSTFAQSLTNRPVKGMLTGPGTILARSFVRTDQLLADTANQVALALRDEAHDLESAGIRIIQLDEPALHELLPPRRRDQEAYLDWAVASFRLATSGVADATQIHTHLCHSEIGELLPVIDALDVDVISVHAPSSTREFLNKLRAAGYQRGIGPGVYDVDSSRVPEPGEITNTLWQAVAVMPAGRLWVNPDCGLKTRSYPEIEASLARVVNAAAAMRVSAG
ncbi:5-methyltetrahydropteroyltriglutamate--homocysteine S-methyltransferase [Micromonospora sp. NPDC050397]|uniref:5-methyltetrahydropteroyltriglutamate-- homocysteine S-methyltransferase n=1 Tax=Micromonospora sp. NPDC050397 TaxID=3364279 RepID=UPI00384CD86F